ncbi:MULTISPECIES: WhiB family transcriptional regulator [unclassified Microbispora]|uniref:WhiB family transcriptional regulator n=1 Tax=unclassified Microbispora TaxID=2614687 RepID=UPI0021AE7AAC|nr:MULTISPECIES: WhiB family transcriptional regulator [unclassified Microbispora]
MCRRCEVRAECLTYALDRGLTSVWGGRPSESAAGYGAPTSQAVTASPRPGFGSANNREP